MISGLIRQLLVLSCICAAQWAWSAEIPVIRVDAGKDITVIPRRLYGTNLRQNMQDNEQIRSFLTRTGITVFRYPDSIDSGYAWDWDPGGVMMAGGRPMLSKLSRLDGAIELSRAVGAEMFFTLRIHETSPEEAARTVAEVRKRGLGGSYWCFGNEPYFKGDKLHIPKEQYVELVHRFAPAMKQADPSIHLGIAWGGPWIEQNSDKGRDSFVLRGTKQWIDFIDFHFYTGRWEKEKGIDANRIMAGSLLVEPHTRGFREIFRREAPEKADRIEIQYWEWNGPPWPAVGGIQTLATGIFAADALGEMARCGVKAAIQYNLQEHACGLIPGFEQDRTGSWATEKWNGKTVRPIAYALELWSRHMGPVMVHSQVSGCGTYSTKDWNTLVNYQGEVPLLSAHATRSQNGTELHLMVVNRNQEDAVEAQVELDRFKPATDAQVLTLNGPNATSHNDVVDRQPPYHSFTNAADPVVKLTTRSHALTGSSFRYRFEPHSVTVIRMKASPGQP